MDILKDDERMLFRRYMTAAVGSAIVISIYSFVDTIAVGQAEGPAGAAAMAVITPLYGLMVFLAYLCGVGGAVLMSRAKGEGKEEEGNAYFTTALLLMAALTLVLWVGFAVFAEEIFTFFGADAANMPLVMEYAAWIIGACPLFTFSTFLGCFLRNDKAPGRAMAAVVAGGLLNMFGDYYFVFPLQMGMAGAAIATVCGTAVQVAVLCSHFFRASCTLRLVRPRAVGRMAKKILCTGISASALELGNVILACIINNQIMHYGGAAALAVYGVLITFHCLLQAMFCGVGQAIQPLVSTNLGAGNQQRMQRFFRMGLAASLAMGVVFTLLGELFPLQLTRLFMKPTPEVLAIAPGIFRIYFLVFLFMSVTVLATYYLQSILHTSVAMAIGLLRSVALSGVLLWILPQFFDLAGVWWAMPVSECLVAVFAAFYLRRVASR